MTLGTLTVAFCGLGFALGLDGFAGNVLAELAGVALSVLIAYTLVEALLRRQRREEWARVSRAIKAAIAARIYSIVFEFSLVDPAGDRLQVMTVEEEIHAVDALAVRIAASASKLADDESIEGATTRRLHRSVEGDLGFISEILAARVLQLGEDQELAEALIELEEAERAWAEGVRLIHDDWGFPDEMAWEAAAGTLAAAARLLRLVAGEAHARRVVVAARPDATPRR